jgi:hypothetical protein
VSGLASVTDRDLASLMGAIERGELSAPITSTALQSRGLGHIAALLQPYANLGPEGLRAVAEVALAERRAQVAPKLTLVWTGDEPGISHARHTRVLLPELFERARELWRTGQSDPDGVGQSDPRASARDG